VNKYTIDKRRVVGTEEGAVEGEWEEMLGRLPKGVDLEGSARASGALVRRREVSKASDLLRMGVSLYGVRLVISTGRGMVCAAGGGVAVGRGSTQTTEGLPGMVRDIDSGGVAGEVERVGEAGPGSSGSAHTTDGRDLRQPAREHGDGLADTCQLGSGSDVHGWD
jgi:hypothetical protein